jgi:hypothetical protein
MPEHLRGLRSVVAYRHEISGGYLWSPKRNANKARNPFYESMREVSPGDIIFSFRDTRRRGIRTHRKLDELFAYPSNGVARTFIPNTAGSEESGARMPCRRQRIRPNNRATPRSLRASSRTLRLWIPWSRRSLARRCAMQILHGLIKWQTC